MTTDNKMPGAFGLCSNCRHAKKIVSSKESVFLMCELSKTDPHFPKYPSLPVRSCPGYTALAPIARGDPLE